MEYKDAFRQYLRTGDDTEIRAMGESGSAGALFPKEFHAELAVQLKAYARLAADFSPVETSNGRPMLAPTAQVASAGTLTTENPGSALGFTNDRVYGQVQLNGYTVTSSSKVSFQLEADSGIPVESMIADYSGEVIGRELSVLSVSGTGSSQPTGVITAANTQGAWSAGGSGGFVALTAAKAIEVDGAATNELAAKGLSPTTLRALMLAVDPAYYGQAKWYFNINALSTLLGTTDTTGQPLIKPNGPLMLWDFPITIAPELPDLTASTVGGPVFGNLEKGMYFRDAGFEVIRTDQRFADALAVGYVGVQRCDFGVRDARAFATVKPAAT